MTDQIIQSLQVLLVCITAIWVTVYLNNRSHRKKAPWYELTKQTDLKFVNKYPAEQAYVVGRYCGHQLKLDAFHDPVTNAGLYTRITLSSNQNTNHSSLENKLTVDQGINLLHSNFGYTLKGKVTSEANAQTIVYTQPGIENDINYLQAVFTLLSEIAKTYPSLVALGGEIVSPLVSDIVDKKIQALRPLTVQLMKDIGEITTNKYSDKTLNLLCPHCFTRYTSLQVQVSRIKTPITYCGCRICNQSREYFEVQVVAVLNNITDQLKSEQNGNLRINWSIHRKLFDFDKIEIVKATDQDVELFAVQAGNDTDPFRQTRYKEIECTILPECELTENTIRVLQRIFGKVQKQHIKA